MSRYTGWEREAVTDSSQRDETSPDAVSSFTPINQKPSSFKPAPKLVRRNSGEFHGGTLHDLAGTSEIQAPKSKRRKTEPTLLDASEHGTFWRDEEIPTLGPNQIPNSLHLGVPPKSKLGKKKIAAKGKFTPKTQPELFPDAPITKKSKQPRRKQGIVQPQAISYQGFTTTEDSLKNPVKLAQTTLDKLASFKYAPSSVNIQAEVPEANSDVSKTFTGDSQSSEFLDYDGGDFTTAAASQTRDSKDYKILDIAHFEDAYFADVAHSHLSNQYEDDFHMKMDDPYDHFQDHQPSVDNMCSEATTKHVVHETHVPVASSEMHAENEAFEHQSMLQDQTLTPIIACDITENAVVENQPRFGDCHVDVTSTIHPASIASCQNRVQDSGQHSQNQFDGLKISNLTVNVETDHTSPSDSSTKIPIEHPNTAARTMVPESASRYRQDVRCEVVEFDDGDINDEDLYAMSIANEGHDCELNAKHSSISQSKAVSPVDLAVTSQGPRISDSDQLTSRNAVTQADGSIPVNSIILHSASNHDSPDSEDEFSIDELEEEALMQFAIPAGTVRETRPPPSSITFPSEGGESRDLEVYDSNLQYSDSSDTNDNRNVSHQFELNQPPRDRESSEENWTFLNGRSSTSNKNHNVPDSRVPLAPIQTAQSNQVKFLAPVKPVSSQAHSPLAVCDDSAEYLPLNPFARPEFPVPMFDRSPVIGFSGNLVLRTCFRVGEAFRVASISDSSKYEILLELFARVAFSSREEGTVKQHFQFADLFHDRPPWLHGILENYKVNDLANTESKQLLGDSGAGQMVRCLCKTKRVYQGKRLLVIQNIRMTDWEEIRRTKRIVEELCGKVKPEGGAGSSYL